MKVESGRCWGMELKPAYVDVAVKRWQAATGEKAVRDSDGATFDEVLASRGQPVS